MFLVNFRLVGFMKLRKISLRPCGPNCSMQESLRKTVSIRFGVASYSESKIGGVLIKDVNTAPKILYVIMVLAKVVSQFVAISFRVKVL